MTRYSDFVKRYMKQSGKSWNCAVCDIKKGDLYKGFKKGEDKQIRSDMEMMGGEDRDAPAPAPKIIKVKRGRRPVLPGQKKVKTLEPSPIPPPMALEPANLNTKTAMPLGVMPEDIGKMIQDFARPRVTEGKLKVVLLYGYALIQNRFDENNKADKLSPKDRKKVKEIIASVERQLGIKTKQKYLVELVFDIITYKENYSGRGAYEPDDEGVIEAKAMVKFMDKFDIDLAYVGESDWIDTHYGADELTDRYGDMDMKKYDRAVKKWYKLFVDDWMFSVEKAKGMVYNATLLEEMMRS
jgi:hypothetical protein